MSLTFAGARDHAVVVRTVDDLTDPVSTTRVATAWERESALSGMTVGGPARHPVSQPECAVEFHRAETPAEAQPVSLLDYYGRVDWPDAATEEPENTSIRDHFKQPRR